MLVQFSSRILAMREKEESCELEEQAIEDKIKQSDLLNDDDDEDDDYDEEEEEEEDDACYVYESPLEEIDAILLYE